MKTTITMLTAVAVCLGFWSSAFAQDNLGLTSPDYISDGGSPPTWYFLVLRNSTITFTANPTTSLSSLTWTFSNSSTGSGSGNGPIIVTYDLDAGEGHPNDVTFTSVRTDGSGATCTSTNKPLMKVVLIDMQYGTSYATPPSSFSTDSKNAVVRLKNANLPTQVFNLQCQMRLSAANTMPNDVTVYLVNPDGRLGFSLSGDATNATQAVTLPKDGSWVNFYVSGQNVSSSIGDAIIEVHKDSTSGTKLGQNALTVYDLDPSDITVGQGHNYHLHTSGTTITYASTRGTAVNFASSAYLKPENLDLTAPQLASLKIGICQAVQASSQSRRVVWGSPTVTSWDPASPPGTTVSAALQAEYVVTVPALVNDSAASVDPMYDQPGKADTIDSNSLAAPKVNSSSTDLATSNDSPDQVFGTTLQLTKTDSAGHNATVTYTAFQSATFDDSFDTWCATYDTTTNTAIALRQTAWSLTATSTSSGQHATCPTSDSSVSIQPLAGPPYTQSTITTVQREVAGSGTTTFTR